MDIAFLRRARRMLGEAQPARLEHDVLLAALAAERGLARAEGGEGVFEDALVEVLSCGPGWRQAASSQRGCFNRVEAGRRTNGA